MTERRCGYIQRIVPHKRCGFIRVPDQADDVFFYAGEWQGDMPFDERLTELRVSFEPVGSGRGWKAKGVEAAA